MIVSYWCPSSWNQSAIQRLFCQNVPIFFTIVISVKILGATYVTRCEGQKSGEQRTASITCDFPQDLSVSKTSFCLYRYESSHTELVLFCHWLNGKPACYSEGQRATYPEAVSYQFTTSLTGNITGNFSCETLPPDDSVVELCSLTSEEIHQSQVQVTKPPASDATTTKHTSSPESDEVPVSAIVLAILLSLSILINLIAAGVIIVYVKQKRCNDQVNSGQDAPSEDTSLPAEDTTEGESAIFLSGVNSEAFHSNTSFAGDEQTC